MPTIVDTSVWIDFFRGVDTPQVDTLGSLLRKGTVAVGDIILSEILQGIRSDSEFNHVRNHFRKIPVYSMGGRDLAVRSARNFRRLRLKGYTVKTVDSFIATFCIESGLPLLHNDRDFDLFQKQLGLKVC
jgi:predicted nucleic acid-binding protein